MTAIVSRHRQFAPDRQLRRNTVCLLIFSAAIFGGLCGRAAHAQDNYEIQVYGADTVAPKTTVLELHSNFTVDGTKPLPDSRYAADGLYPTNHAEHETVEITQGIIAGHDLKRGLYTGQFGCFYIEQKNEAGAYDQEIFLTLHDWNAYMGAATDASMDASYDYSTINDRMLGHGTPIQVKLSQRVLFRIVNASATVTHWLALAGHEMTVISMDGNPVPVPSRVTALRLAPAERADVFVEMKNPGVWILGETRDDIRKAGMGIVVEYAGQQGAPKWIDPPEVLWSYRPFAHPEAATIQPDHQIPLLFESKFRGHGDFDYWTINGKSYPKTDTVMLQQGKRYRLVMRNKSADDHPVHLHRHTFEVTSLDGKPMSGLRKDVVVVTANSIAEVDFVAANPGATLFHCHQQSHMDFGFMMLFRYS